ncbi:MAG: hypothetical protein IJP54_00430 [Synergistaceae bacterium]|nr:hypothetical protein [Synergistaceae bacterium]MBR0034120.1 hypothetical protein [Synergistaceae bacterium]
MHYDICVIGTKDTTIKLAEYLCENICRLDLIITIDPSAVNTANISGYSPVSDYARQKNISLFTARDYSLQDSESAEFFGSSTFGLGICMGWQRLIPKSVLESFSAGIFGFHGSCGYLPYGRGRSPLNWSVINGDTRFILNLFRYDEHADSPNVYKNRMFEVNPHDTIRTLQYKNILVSYELVSSLIKDYKAGTVRINTAAKDFSTLYPKRTPEDGRIDFHAKTREIYNLVRGVTKPFPGAFCFLRDGGHKVLVWDAVPFDSVMDFSGYEAGEVIEVFDGMPIVRTIDGSLLIRDYDCERKIVKNDVLS